MAKVISAARVTSITSSLLVELERASKLLLVELARAESLLLVELARARRWLVVESARKRRSLLVELARAKVVWPDITTSLEFKITLSMFVVFIVGLAMLALFSEFLAR